MTRHRNASSVSAFIQSATTSPLCSSTRRQSKNDPMNGLRDMVDSSPQLRVIQTQATPEPLAPARWDWSEVRKVLFIRLRSIGDTVLSTPCLFALRRILPDAQIDILVEDWVAPLLDRHPHLNNIIS